MKQPKLNAPSFQADPFLYWHHLREHTPVFNARLPDGRRAWLVTRHDDAIAVLKDQRFLKDPVVARGQGAKPPWMPAFLRPISRNMLDLDGADHDRLRRLIHRAFTPRRVASLHGRISAICDELIDAMPAGREIDLVSSYALPLPVTVIAELIGIPVEDRGQFHEWTKRIVAVSSPTGIVAGLPAIVLFMRYIRRLIAKRRHDPQDDLLTALIQAEEAGDALSEDELIGMITLLIIAGHETTVNLISCGMLALMQNTDQMDQLKKDPGVTAAAVEELARYVSPVSVATERYAGEDMEIRGTDIRRGDQVLAVLSSANRDEREFASPGSLNVGRSPNRHLAFGQGIHYCVGAPLARMEVQVAIETLLRRAPEIRVADPRSTLRWRPGLFLRGVQALPVRK